ncbi:hypothetical protein [Moorena sp. SIO3A5]|uniref:hypothetical protein n=1 Tax=Moorena sp. SIO3A5 TaxID=2607822 RepID=UPI00141C421B|nr:hypothetical protein [Moorena sp. SIO3A5]NEP68998.1 hypothetical protein [Moorena sp. SIO3A5]
MNFTNKLTAAAFIGLSIIGTAGVSEAQYMDKYEARYWETQDVHQGFFKPVKEDSIDLRIEYALVDEINWDENQTYSTFDYLVIRQSRATELWGVQGDITFGRPHHQEEVDNSQDGYITSTTFFRWEDEVNQYEIAWVDFPEMNFTLTVRSRNNPHIVKYENHFGSYPTPNTDTTFFHKRMIENTLSLAITQDKQRNVTAVSLVNGDDVILLKHIETIKENGAQFGRTEVWSTGTMTIKFTADLTRLATQPSIKAEISRVGEAYEVEMYR